MWDPLISYFTSHEDVEKPGKVRTIFSHRFNTFFQVSTAHNLCGESIRLLKTVLGFFIQPQNIIQHSDDLTKIRFNDPSAHLPNDELYVGDSTTALLVHLNEN